MPQNVQSILGFDDLILMKMASNRLKDKADVKELQRIRKFREKGEMIKAYIIYTLRTTEWQKPYNSLR